MKNDKEKFKTEFKGRIYNWILKLIGIMDRLPQDNSSKIISTQLIRSSTSVGANYIEAQAASSKKDFINFLHHSLKSANESTFWIALLRDSEKLNGKESENLIKELTELSNMLAASIITAKGKNIF